MCFIRFDFYKCGNFSKTAPNNHKVSELVELGAEVDECWKEKGEVGDHEALAANTYLLFNVISRDDDEQF